MKDSAVMQTAGNGGSKESAGAAAARTKEEPVAAGAEEEKGGEDAAAATATRMPSSKPETRRMSACKPTPASVSTAAASAYLRLSG
uniref:Uncharacterized protein n=2 Tax=Oryza TaxID=4527 RepID=A0A679BAY5_9ORYZ|nr:hypothetical protein [Oryza barthii]BBF89325.1 hypothetical protein [Oryza barthii]BBF89551.1 hypothetical protein [Oryza glaberrima]